MKKDRETQKAIDWMAQSYRVLESETGIDKSRWVRYFHDLESPNYRSFKRMATAAEVSVPDIVFAYETQRAKVLQKREDQVK